MCCDGIERKRKNKNLFTEAKTILLGSFVTEFRFQKRVLHISFHFTIATRMKKIIKTVNNT